MRLIYTPEDGEKQEFSFVPGKLMSPDAEAIEAAGGDMWSTYDRFGELFMAGNRRAYRAVLWIMLRRADPGLRFQSLVVRVDELDVELDDDELQRMRVRLETDETMDEGQRIELLTMIRDADSPDPKGGSGPSPTGVAVTGGTSPTT